MFEILFCDLGMQKWGKRTQMVLWTPQYLSTIDIVFKIWTWQVRIDSKSGLKQRFKQRMGRCCAGAPRFRGHWYAFLYSGLIWRNYCLLCLDGHLCQLVTCLYSCLSVILLHLYLLFDLSWMVPAQHFHSQSLFPSKWPLTVRDIGTDGQF